MAEEAPTQPEMERPEEKHKMTTKELLVGSYDWGFLCKPQFPYSCWGLFGEQKIRKPPQFFAREAHLGILTALAMGAQHALAMVGGLIVPPLLIVPYGTPDADEIKRYLVQAALIVTGIMTVFQVAGMRPLAFLPFPWAKKFPLQWGAGILSVMGVSFATVPIAQIVIPNLIKEGKTFEDAYGHLLGTLCVTCITPLLMSQLPIAGLKKVFPPVVSGVTIVLIGINLCGSGLKNWGGGAYCASHYLDTKVVNGTSIPNPVLCSDNGNVLLPFGSKEYVGLGFAVFCMIIFVEIFGSPFLRNCSPIIGLLFGYFVSVVSNRVNDGDLWVTSAKFDSAPGITFLWTKTFPLTFYPAAVIPLIIVNIITCIESVGDTTATIEASREPVHGTEYAMRIKGALLNDGISGIFSALATSLPLTTFAQNNGVISLTSVASRQAGYGCAFWLLLLGILGKVGAFITSIPNCVVGGMTTFLFANVISSGIKIIISEGTLDRRTRFIMACSLGLGIGVTLVPQWGDYWLWPSSQPPNEAVKSVRDAICIILDTGFCLGAIVAFVLNLIMPQEAVDKAMLAYEASLHASKHAERMGTLKGSDKEDEEDDGVAAKGGAVALEVSSQA